MNKKTKMMMAMAAFSIAAIAQRPADYVNPIIGTNGMGHTFLVHARLLD